MTTTQLAEDDTATACAVGQPLSSINVKKRAYPN